MTGPPRKLHYKSGLSLFPYSDPTALVTTGRGQGVSFCPHPCPAQSRNALGFPLHLPRKGAENTWAGPAAHSPGILTVPGSNPFPALSPPGLSPSPSPFPHSQPFC